MTKVYKKTDIMINKVAVFLCCFFIPTIFFGQIKISESIQLSTIAKEDENSLYFIDFWATWCKPCIHVSKYLESLQRQYTEDFYILSLTKENPSVVKRFLIKHKINLGVAIDYDGETFDKYKVQSLPYGILLNANGEKLWEGHPADFKTTHIKTFLKLTTKKQSVSNMIKIEAYKSSIANSVEIIDSDFNFEKLPVNDVKDPLRVVKYKSHIELQGSLQKILAYTSNIHSSQIEIPESLNHSYKMHFKFDSNAYTNKSATILDALKIEHMYTEEKGEVLVFDVKTPMFWDTKQIDWGEDTQHFLIGDSEIQADNVTLNQVKYQLSKLLEMPIIINNEKHENTLHDWQIHYKYFGLMASSMSDNYGIDVVKTIANYPKYIIKQKAP